MKEKGVVFGGSGFLGSHVADTLSDEGYSVVIYDLKPSPYLRKDQKMVVGDILDQEKVGKAVKGAKYVYNFAGIAEIYEAAKRPVDTVKYNILGHTIVLDACAKNSVDRVLFASSIYVYGKHGSFYRLSKQACELLCDAYQDEYSLNYTVLRYGSLYGPRAQEWNGIVRFFPKPYWKAKLTIQELGRRGGTTYMCWMPPA